MKLASTLTLYCCCSIIVVSCLGSWSTLTPASTKGSLAIILPMTASASTSTTVATNTFLLAFDDNTILSLAYPSLTSTSYLSSGTYSAFLQTVAYSGSHNAIYASLNDGSLLAYPLTNVQPSTTWATYIAPVANQWATQLLPFTDGMQLGLYWTTEDGRLMEGDPYQGTSNPIYSLLTAAASAFVYVEYQQDNGDGAVKFIVTGYEDGSVTKSWITSDNHQYNILVCAPSGGPITKIITYRNGASVWIILAQGNQQSPYGLVTVIDLKSSYIIFRPNGAYYFGVTDVTIITDDNLVDYMVVALWDGTIFMYPLNGLDWSTSPITLTDNTFISQVNPVIALHSNWLSSSGEPVLIAASLFGTVGALFAYDIHNWQIIATPQNWGTGFLPQTYQIDYLNSLPYVLSATATTVTNYLTVALEDGQSLYLEDSDWEMMDAQPALAQSSQQILVEGWPQKSGHSRKRSLSSSLNLSSSALSEAQIKHAIFNGYQITMQLTSTTTSITMTFLLVGYQYQTEPSDYSHYLLIVVPDGDTDAQSIEYDSFFNYPDALGNIYIWTTTSLD